MFIIRHAEENFSLAAFINTSTYARILDQAPETLEITILSLGLL